MNESVGYKVKKELEKIIYEDSGIYRFKQYKKANSNIYMKSQGSRIVEKKIQNNLQVKP